MKDCRNHLLGLKKYLEVIDFQGGPYRSTGFCAVQACNSTPVDKAVFANIGRAIDSCVFVLRLQLPASVGPINQSVCPAIHRSQETQETDVDSGCNKSPSPLANARRKALTTHSAKVS